MRKTEATQLHRVKMKRTLSQHKMIPRDQMVMPEKNIKVVIRESPLLLVFISDEGLSAKELKEKIAETKLKYSGK